MWHADRKPDVAIYGNPTTRVNRTEAPTWIGRRAGNRQGQTGRQQDQQGRCPTATQRFGGWAVRLDQRGGVCSRGEAGCGGRRTGAARRGGLGGWSRRRPCPVFGVRDGASTGGAVEAP